MEQKLKNLLGECTFQICALQHQLDEAKKQIEELEKKKK